MVLLFREHYALVADVEIARFHWFLNWEFEGVFSIQNETKWVEIMSLRMDVVFVLSDEFYDV